MIKCKCTVQIMNEDPHDVYCTVQHVLASANRRIRKKRTREWQGSTVRISYLSHACYILRPFHPPLSHFTNSSVDARLSVSSTL
jgi:hypothetical protein